MAHLSTLPSRVNTLPSRLSGSRVAVVRIRGRKLQRIRERYLRMHPLCEVCLRGGRPVPATEVDHIVALVNGGAEEEFDDSNRQALCAQCHKAKTARDLALAAGG